MYCVPVYFAFIVIVAVFLSLKKRYSYWKNKGVPHPEPTLLIGNTGKVATLTATMSNIIHDIYWKHQECAYVGLFTFWTPAIIVRDVRLIKDVLLKHFNNFHDNWIRVFEETDPIFARNIFLLRGDKWKESRSTLSKQFTMAKLKHTVPLMQNVANRWIDYIEEQTKLYDSNCFAAKDLSGRYTGDVTLLCGYGLEGKSFTDNIPVAFYVGGEMSSTKLSVQIKQTIALFSPSLGRLFNVTFIGKPVPDLFYKLIIEAVEHREKNGIAQNDYLGFLAKARQSGATDHDIIAYAFNFFLDAFDSTSEAISYVFYELALHPDIQSKTREEINYVLKAHQGVLNHESLLEMKYLKNVVFETLRKNTIFNVIVRECTENIAFPSPGGSSTKQVVIEKGTLILLPIQCIHHDPQYYPDPEKFDPDRFSENANSPFFGFGDGPRVCLGRNFAMLEIQVALVTILTKYELRMNNKTKVPYEPDLLQLMNVPKGGIYIDFCKRT